MDSISQKLWLLFYIHNIKRLSYTFKSYIYNLKINTESALVEFSILKTGLFLIITQNLVNLKQTNMENSGRLFSFINKEIRKKHLIEGMKHTLIREKSRT